MKKTKAEPKSFMATLFAGVKKLIKENVKVDVKGSALVITIRPPKNLQLNLFEEKK